MAKDKDIVTYIQTKETIDFTTGEVTTEENITNRRKSTEPAFIKLYLDCLLTFKELSKSLNNILLEFLKHMSYASTQDQNGGQIIYSNGELKRRIAENTGKTVKRIDQALTDFVKTGVFKRIAIGTYQVNPNLFGRGEWKDISSIRATFDFNTGDMEAEITRVKEIEE